LRLFRQTGDLRFRDRIYAKQPPAPASRADVTLETTTPVQTAAVSVLFGTEDAWTISRTTRLALVDAAVDLFFDRLRNENRG